LRFNIPVFCLLVLLFCSLQAQENADYIVVEKSIRTMTLFANQLPIRTFKISLGADPQGHKQREGDERTPEGIYRIDYRNGQSIAHRSLHISYPNEEDKARAKKAGNRPGGNIMIHGITKGYGWLGPLHRFFDWTDGCIGVTNAEIEEIWNLVPNGTTIEIRP
jgi:murein L,D-transpeptidase YafK